MALDHSPDYLVLQFLIMPPGNVYLSTDQICVSL